MRTQFDQLKGTNDAALNFIDQRQQTLEKAALRTSLQNFDVKNQVDIDKLGKISAPFRQRIVLCKTGYDFFKHSNSTRSNVVDFMTTPGADVIKSSNTPSVQQQRLPRALNPLKVPGKKLKTSFLYSSIPDSLPRTGADSPRDLIREEDGTASTSPRYKQTESFAPSFK